MAFAGQFATIPPFAYISGSGLGLPCFFFCFLGFLPFPSGPSLLLLADFHHHIWTIFAELAIMTNLLHLRGCIHIIHIVRGGGYYSTCHLFARTRALWG